MKSTTKSVFGDIISDPGNLAIAFLLNLWSTGTIHQNHGQEIFYLKVALLTNSPLKIEKTFMVARATNEYAEYVGPFTNTLFRDLHNGRFSEDRKRELGLFLLEKYKEGDIKEEDLATKLAALVHTNAKSNCRFCTRTNI